MSHRLLLRLRSLRTRNGLGATLNRTQLSDNRTAPRRHAATNKQGTHGCHLATQAGSGAFRMRARLGILLASAALFWARGGPPGPPPDPATRLAEIRTRVNATKPVDVTAQRALVYSRLFLASAEKDLRSGQSFKADRMAEAADALLHVAEHQQHLRAGGGPKGPPPAGPTADHLQRVYFRTQQADYFFQQSGDKRAAAFPQWARDFYQLAVRAHERNDLVAADENAKCAEEIVKALENLAQAATPGIGPPAPPPVPKPPVL